MKLHSLYSILIFAILISCTNDPTITPTVEEINYENPLEITINGYTDHAMEPFISPDGNTLFFNSLNSGIDTKLYYATKVDATTFTFMGEVNGANQVNNPQLNAVAGLDILNTFYWVSFRDFPVERDNLFYASFNNGTLTNSGRIHGDFYNYGAGWLVMDHGISVDGQTFYYNNARFDGTNCAGPCETFIGIAKKTTTDTFLKTTDSDTILQNINDQNYIYYAPYITQDNLELYYTRYLQGTITNGSIVEICVATRTTDTAIFSEPKVLFSDNLLNSIVEAPSLTIDKQVMYYHKKINGIHKIMMRKRI